MDASLEEALCPLGATILNEPVPERLYQALGTRPAMDHRSFRDQPTFSIGFALGRNRELLRRLLKDHVTDDAREQLAKRVIEHLELCGFTIDEDEQVMKRRKPRQGHG